MFLLYLKEKSTWIAFIISLLLFINLLFYLDAGFSGVSIRYFNIVISSVIAAFSGWRYVKETGDLKTFLGMISNEGTILDAEQLAFSPFQRKYMEHHLKVMGEKENQLRLTKRKLIDDNDHMLAWVHEMKTPLTAMKLMIEQVDNAKLRNRLENEWMRTHLLLDQQLHHTRLSSIEKDNRLEKMSLKTVVFKEIKEFQPWCMEKGIGFQVEGLTGEIVSDKKWLSFIIRQLLSNAIKYSHHNEEIKIFTEQTSSGHALLHIQDAGIGISPEDLPRIFHKSYTGTIGREFVQSTGMGLFLAKNACEKLGIRIWVNSQLHSGSTFILQFPLENEYQQILGR